MLEVFLNDFWDPIWVNCVMDACYFCPDLLLSRSIMLFKSTYEERIQFMHIMHLLCDEQVFNSSQLKAILIFF